jgi:hypothetical protein
MRRSVLALAAVALAAPAPTAAAAEPGDADCAPGFSVVRPHPVSVETVTRIDADATGIERIEVDWGDGARSVEPTGRGAGVTAFHRFRRDGPVDVVVVPVCAGDARGSAVRLRLEVLPPCARRRDRSVTEPDCDDARASLMLADVGGQSGADWVDAPCRDTWRTETVRAPGDPPRARKADCLADFGNPLVGPLYTRPGSAIRLTFGAPVRRAVVRIGTRTHSLHRVAEARPVTRSGREWRFRLSRPGSRRLRRLYVVAFRPGQTDWYVIDLRLS